LGNNAKRQRVCQEYCDIGSKSQKAALAKGRRGIAAQVGISARNSLFALACFSSKNALPFFAAHFCQEILPCQSLKTRPLAPKRHPTETPPGSLPLTLLSPTSICPMPKRASEAGG